jgi:hypothetical protein
VGHTHEDIDARFGTLSQHIREMNIYTPQALLSAIKDAFIGDCEVTFVGAIFDYSDYYDAFVDHTLMIKKMEFTVLGWRYQALTEEEKLANPALLDVAVNYKKVAQDLSVELREHNPLYDKASNSPAEIYYAVIFVSKWMPFEATYVDEQSIGISILDKRPVGTPKPHALKPWAAKHKAFMRGMRAKFPRESEKYILTAHEQFVQYYMPVVPNVYPVQPSDDIFDFVVTRGSDFQPPLGMYLYGERPMGFEHLRDGRKPTVTPCEPSTLDTAFTGTFAGKEVSVRFATPISFLIPPSHLSLLALTLQDLD